MYALRSGEVTSSLCGDGRLGLADSFPLFLPPLLVLGVIVRVDGVSPMPSFLVPQGWLLGSLPRRFDLSF
jgi:hypothetical protein